MEFVSVIAVVGLEKKTGKTFTSIALASYWQRRGRRVALFDGDRARRATRFVRSRNMDARRFEGRWLRPDLLCAHCEEERALGVVDAPSGDREAQWSALMAADVAVIPWRWSTLTSKNVEAMMTFVAEARAVRPWLKLRCFLTDRSPGMFEPRTLEDYGVPPDALLPASLPRRLDYDIAFRYGRNVDGAAGRELTTLVAMVEALLPWCGHYMFERSTFVDGGAS